MRVMSWLSNFRRFLSFRLGIRKFEIKVEGLRSVGRS